jgi:hypothetical protein
MQRTSTTPPLANLEPVGTLGARQRTAVRAQLCGWRPPVYARERPLRTSSLRFEPGSELPKRGIVDLRSPTTGEALDRQVLDKDALIIGNNRLDLLVEPVVSMVPDALVDFRDAQSRFRPVRRAFRLARKHPLRLRELAIQPLEKLGFSITRPPESTAKSLSPRSIPFSASTAGSVSSPSTLTTKLAKYCPVAGLITVTEVGSDGSSLDQATLHLADLRQPELAAFKNTELRIASKADRLRRRALLEPRRPHSGTGSLSFEPVEEILVGAVAVGEGLPQYHRAHLGQPRPLGCLLRLGYQRLRQHRRCRVWCPFGVRSLPCRDRIVEHDPREPEALRQGRSLRECRVDPEPVPQEHNRRLPSGYDMSR